MQKGVSIIICTYNGKLRLAETLEHLFNQKLKCATEIILVDNASTDDSKNFADQWWSKNGTGEINYRSFIQSIPGKSYAQNLGYAKASYKYLLICDDDNWLSPHYVQTAFEIMESNATIGALGGWCEAVFEGDRPNWFDTNSKYYAVSKQGIESGDITLQKGCLYGAGMVLRKSHWERLNELGFRPLLTCRKGDALSSGGDTEYSYVLRLLGYKIWFDDRLYFQHFMPSRRVDLEYIKRIRKAISKSNFVLKAYKDKLNSRYDTKKQFHQRFIFDMRHNLKSNLIKRFKGSFEEKEQAKEFFRNLKRSLFNHKLYKNTYNTIERWHSY